MNNHQRYLCNQYLEPLKTRGLTEAEAEQLILLLEKVNPTLNDQTDFDVELEQGIPFEGGMAFIEILTAIQRLFKNEKPFNINLKPIKGLIEAIADKQIKQSSSLDVIKSEKVKNAIVARCGEDPISDGIQCRYCGCLETYKDRKEPNNTNKWYFMIKAFKIDDKSNCTNCDSWF